MSSWLALKRKAMLIEFSINIAGKNIAVILPPELA
jgi:hypothetical protein